MRRKSERTVKSSPMKKSEPTSRRSMRRGRKSPEKSVNEEESEHSTDQASSSENEPEEVIPPKRTRRTSRTIEKSSSAEEVKATTTTRLRRARGSAKKDADIPEEENVVDAEQNAVTDEPTLNEIVEETNIEKIETTNSSSVDSSTEPAAINQTPIEDSNNSVPDDNEKEITPSNVTENNQEPEENVKNAITIEIKPDISEPVESTKTRRRTLKRLEREIIKEDTPQVIEEKTTNEQIENDVDSNGKSPKKLSNDEVKSSDDSKLVDQPEVELQNGNVVNNDAADTTAKDTTASETDSRTKSNKKKPIVRKRKWLTNKTAAPKVQEIAISTDSLKGLISDVKPVPLSDVKLDSSPEADRESDVIVSSTSIDYNRRSEEHLVESTEDANAVNITTSRKISIVNESEGEPLSPAKHSPSNILYITNLVRPFTVLQLKSLLQRTGKIAEDGFWMDKIKSKCFVKYETEDEAIETRHALHGIRWPTSNPKNLNVDFGTESLMEKAIASTADEVKQNILSRHDRIASSVDLHESTRDKVTLAERPVREWDLGKKDSHRPREVERIEREKEREQKQSREIGRDNERERERDRERDRDRDHRVERDRGERRRRSASVSPSRKYTKKDNEPPLRLLDDLFRKTKTAPCIYWLPLTPEQIAVRIEERKKAFERREALRKEREREDAVERERRREKRREESREKRREESRDGEKRRESRDKEKRRDDSHERRDRVGQRDIRDKRRRY